MEVLPSPCRSARAMPLYICRRIGVSSCFFDCFCVWDHMQPPVGGGWLACMFVRTFVCVRVVLCTSPYVCECGHVFARFVDSQKVGAILLAWAGRFLMASIRFCRTGCPSRSKMCSPVCELLFHRHLRASRRRLRMLCRSMLRAPMATEQWDGGKTPPTRFFGGGFRSR